MTRLSTRTQQIVALGLALLCVAVLWRFAVDPLRGSLSDLEREISEAEQALTVHRRVIDTEMPLRERLDGLQGKASSATQILSGGSAELAAAELQRRVLETVESQGGTVETTEILPSQATEFFRKVSVRITLTTDLATLQGMIYALETAHPLLFIGSLDVRRRNPGTTRTIRVAAAELQLRMDVYAYMEGSDL